MSRALTAPLRVPEHAHERLDYVAQGATEIFGPYRGRGTLMLEIWGRKNSFNVQKVLWCCEELESSVSAPRRWRAVRGTGEDEYLQRNPTGLVPTIVDGDLTLWESNTIVATSRQATGPAASGPRIPQRGHSRTSGWTISSARSFPPSRTPLLGLVRTAPEDRNPRENRSLRPRHGRQNRRSGRTSRRQRLRGGLLIHHGRCSPGFARLPLARAGHRQARPARPPGLVRATRGPPRIPEDRHGLLRDGGTRHSQGPDLTRRRRYGQSRCSAG